MPFGDMSHWLGLKYAALGEQANAAMTSATGQADLAEASAGQVGANSAAQRELERSQAGLVGAQAGQVAPTAAAARALDYANAGEAGQRGGYYGALGSSVNNDTNRLTTSGEGSALEQSWRSRILGGAGGVTPGSVNDGGATPSAGGFTTGGSGYSDYTQPGNGPSNPGAHIIQFDQPVPTYAEGTSDVPRSVFGLRPSVPAGPSAPGLQGPPGPGQTITNGSWGSPTPNQDLRAGVGGGMVKSYDAGTQKVPGKDRGVDTVPAMLRPREAVLVPGAADAIGRDKIAALNAIHNAQQPAGGQPQPQAPARPVSRPQAPAQKAPAPQAPQKPAGRPQAKPAPGAPAKGAKPAGKAPGKPAPAAKGKPQDFAKGTHEVKAGKSASTPKIDPGALQALAGMLGQSGGGGMVPPGAGGAGGPPQGGPMTPPQRGGGMI